MRGCRARARLLGPNRGEVALAGTLRPCQQHGPVGPVWPAVNQRQPGGIGRTFEKIVAAKALCVRQRKCKLTRMNAACHASLHAGVIGGSSIAFSGEVDTGSREEKRLKTRNSSFGSDLVPGITNRYCSPSFETATEPVIGRAFARPVGGLLRMRSSLLKHNNLMLRSERRERLEARAASDSSISHRQY